MQITFHVWRQKDGRSKGKFSTYTVTDLKEDMSFLEALDVLNEQLISQRQEEPIAFDYDCREGICGMCSLVINGVPHGKEQGTTCQLHMRSFSDGDEIYVEPWRAQSFPVVKDLVVDRGAFDRIMATGGYVSVNTGSAPEAHSFPVQKKSAEKAFDAAACIGCGACVATCKNSSAMLFVAAKVAHLAHLPQGSVERKKRAVAMLRAHDQEGFGGCTNTKACEAVCPKDISASTISLLNRQYLTASLTAPQLHGKKK